MSAPLIQNVSDTAYLVAAHRAIETRRSDALFRDPLAQRLVGERGPQIAHAMARASDMTGWMVAIRTCIIDDFIVQAVAHGADIVLNLGAGLDTRPYRLAVPASLQWVEVDFPHVVEWKQTQLVQEMPACRLERIGLDLTDRAARRALFTDVQSRSRNALVLTEGVVPYLDEPSVAALADDLRMHTAVQHWIVDYFSPQVHRYRNRAAIERRMRNAPWQFQPADYLGFFAAHGWRPKATRYLAVEGRRLNRPAPLPRLLRWWIRFTWLLAPQDKRDALTKTAGYVLFAPA